MKSVLLCALFCFAAAELLTLGASDFDAAVSTHSPNGLLVKFFAPWCGHCKQMAPAFKAAAAKFGQAGGPRLADVDCTEHQSVCNKFGVQGYPTLKFFKGSEVLDYQGPRDAEGIEKWIKKKTAPAPVLANKEALDAFVTGTKKAIVGFFRENKDKDAQATFKQLSNNADFEDFEFAETLNADLFDFVPVSRGNANIVVYNGGVVIAKFSEDFTGALAWLEENAFALVTNLQENRFPKLAQTKQFVVVLFTGANEQSEIDLLTKVGKEFSSTLGFVHGVGSQYAQHASMLGISGKVFPVLVGIKGEKYFPSNEDKEFNEENIKAYLSDLSSGKLTANFKSEPVPESNDGPVTVIVGHTFDDIVVKSDKHVLVEFYAPWCGHCKSLAPIYEKLGEKFKGTDVTIAKIDATANDHPISGVTGFPTIKFFPKGKKDSPVDYEGGRTLEDFVAFLEEQTGSAGKEEL